jgi:hypothetical protein
MALLLWFSAYIEARLGPVIPPGETERPADIPPADLIPAAEVPHVGAAEAIAPAA